MEKTVMCTLYCFQDKKQKYYCETSAEAEILRFIAYKRYDEERLTIRHFVVPVSEVKKIMVPESELYKYPLSRVNNQKETEKKLFEENMGDYNGVYSEIYESLLLQSDEFDFEKASLLAFKISPGTVTKNEIIEITANLLNEMLNNGYVTILKNGNYKSIFSKEKIEDVLQQKNMD